MSQTRYTYRSLNIFSVLAPVITAFIASSTNDKTIYQYGFYFFGGLAAINVMTALLSTRLVNSQKFYISISIMMFTCSLMVTIFFQQTNNHVLVVSIILLQAIIAFPALLYGLILKLQLSIQRKKNA